METTHSHHLEIHSSSLLSQLKPEIKIVSTFMIVLSIAFLSLDSTVSIMVQTLIVLLMINFLWQFLSVVGILYIIGIPVAFFIFRKNRLKKPSDDLTN